MVGLLRLSLRCFTFFESAQPISLPKLDAAIPDQADTIGGADEFDELSVGIVAGFGAGRDQLREDPEDKRLPLVLHPDDDRLIGRRLVRRERLTAAMVQ
jgi:hypothetical protein